MSISIMDDLLKIRPAGPDMWSHGFSEFRAHFGEAGLKSGTGSGPVARSLSGRCHSPAWRAFRSVSLISAIAGRHFSDKQRQWCASNLVTGHGDGVNPTTPPLKWLPRNQHFGHKHQVSPGHVVHEGRSSGLRSPRHLSTGFYADRQATVELQDQESRLAHLPLRPADRNLPDILSSEGVGPLQPSRFSYAGC